MDMLKFIFLISTTLTLTNSTLAASNQHSADNDRFDDAERIIVWLYNQQQQIEKEIDQLTASFSQDNNQIRRFNNCKLPDCHQYSETTSFRLDPNQNFTYQNQVSRDGLSKSISRSGKFNQHKGKQTLILNNADGQPELYLYH
ncbi:hypothetical protein BGI40_01240 [Snodgrassella communis]|jgi:hypothetical protein|uniref:Uncharacterized protein n=1 Tax=Snodgrassella communis TaxID=2946699 RepID=A0A066THZ0_9NEIS|nr:hypothetical protein [Snodgrassella communis]KDN11841.1 hypothetical protein SALWKB12_1763 [Snodgrassella communis]KDN14706.1 hypothetical protein SALWKB29_1165 [Snodgrassella communis]PIT07576.1 hypothetical protein BGI29_09350 [Snodgrassella communis]PIT28019.1 hypothetical protein BGI39_06160 [Snodgrassella communis]PIT30112.1 hypothetical protein BGI38_01425 [Snodgrassella communis]